MDSSLCDYIIRWLRNAADQQTRTFSGQNAVWLSHKNVS